MKLTREESFWRRTLDLASPKAVIPFEFEARESFEQDFYEFDFTNEQNELIKKFTAGDDLKLQIVLLATTGLLLANYTQIKRVRFGTPADKTEAALEAETMIPLELDLSGGKSFREVLNQTKQLLVDGVFHQNYDFSLLREPLVPVDGNPIYDVICSLTNIQVTPANNLLESNVMFIFTSEREELSGKIAFNKARYSKEFINDIAKNFREYLAASLADADRLIEQIYLSNAHQHITTDFMFLPTDEPTFIERFEAMAGTTPEKTAVESNDGLLTFQQLNERSNKLARHLSARNSGRGSVALYLDNSLETVVGVLGILKAGFSFVPIDTKLPWSRVKFILEDSDSQIVITKGKSNELLPPGFSVIEIGNFSKFAEYAVSNLNLNISREQPCYTIYTSGTSGTPKGVVVLHSSLINYVNWACERYTNNGRRLSSFPLFGSISFDLTITSIFVPLVSAGSIVIYPLDQSIDMVLDSILRDKKVGILKITPSHLRILVEGLRKGNINDLAKTSLHTLVVGGEIFSVKLAEEFSKYFEGTDIYNEYGPTEATVGCMIHKYSSRDLKYLTVPIGMPIDNAIITILDENNLQVPDGAIGEIFIGGLCLSKGYLNNDEMTNSKFVFLSNMRAIANRFYKTGDLAKRLSNGNYIYVGRKDSQMKINGYRIEPEEIESCAKKYPAVKEATVVCKESENYSFQIALYFTADGKISEFEISRFMANLLPEYMLPHQIIHVENIPLTSNGKVDVVSLLRICEQETDVTRLPTNEIEARLFTIWTKHLEVEELGINDNFYTSGGDSIKSLGLMNDINKNFEKKMQIKDLYVLKTIKNMAAYIANDDSNLLEIINNDKQQVEKELITNEIDKLKREILERL